jgi:tetratricopeptide (TPR) repeat protein
MLAVVYRDQGRLSEAESLFRETLNANRRVRGPDHPETLATQHELARVYLEQGNLASAEQLFRQTLAIRNKVLPADDPNLASTLDNLGLALIQLNRPTEAEPFLREAMAIKGKKAPDRWDTFETRNRLGGALLGQKKYAAAEPLLVEGYEGMKAREAEIPAQFKKRVTAAAERIIQLYDSWGKPDQAAEWRKRLQAR